MPSSTLRILVIVAATTLTVATFVDNCIVFLALTVGRRRPNQQTFSLGLTLSLIVADLLLSMTTMPLSVYLTFRDADDLGYIFCKFYSAIDILLCQSSIFHLTGLAFDRYLAVCRPFFHRRLTMTWARLTGLTLWLLSALVAFFQFPWIERAVLTDGEPGVEVDFGFPTDTRNISCDANLPPYGIICVTVVLGFFLPLAFIGGFHLAILRTLQVPSTVVVSRSQTAGRICCDDRETLCTDAGEMLSCKDDADKCDDVGETDEDVRLKDKKIVRSTNFKGRPAKAEATENRFVEDVAVSGGTEKQTVPGIVVETVSDTADDACSVRDAITHSNEINARTVVNLKTPSASTEALTETTGHEKKQHRFKSTEKLNDPSLLQTKKPRGDRAIKPILCLVLCFVVCWAPFFFVLLVMDPRRGNLVYADPVMAAVNWLGYINSTINPFLYYRFNRTIRRAIRGFLRFKDETARVKKG